MLPDVSGLTKKIEANTALLAQLADLIRVLNSNVEKQNALLAEQIRNASAVPQPFYVSNTFPATGTVCVGGTTTWVGTAESTLFVDPATKITGTNSTGPK